jgi:hypothetical protein
VVTRRNAGRGIRAAVILGCTAALVSSPSSNLNAQEVRLRPEAGFSRLTRISVQNGVLQVRQRIGVSVGARLTLVFNRRFDVVTGITYIPGFAVFRGAGKLIHMGTSSHLLTASTGARYWLVQPMRKLSWEVHTGFGAAFGGQPAYEDLFESSTLSGVLGSTLHYQIGRIVRLRLRVQGRLYRVRFGGSDPGSSGPALRFSLGLTLPFLDSARAIAS